MVEFESLGAVGGVPGDDGVGDDRAAEEDEADVFGVRGGVVGVEREGVGVGAADGGGGGGDGIGRDGVDVAGAPVERGRAEVVHLVGRGNDVGGHARAE